MIPLTTRSVPDAAVRFPREIAAAVTLPAACAALVAADPAALRPAAAIAVLTASAALATRLAIVEFLAAPGSPDPRAVRSFDPFSDPMPAGLQGVGPEPDRDRLRRAGERATAAWQFWRTDDPAPDTTVGAAGALSIGAWCAWALGSSARAETRARYALETRADDPLAGLVLRSVLARSAPTWERR
ncbi:hypothetical protein [Curtobacterium sp. ISL-83]|uniref:hypothetical protein n=1 Tax=Curtobacterium sp. ISL-83 TaxID=2819145 RepID=UPI001BE64922|nr:hypothetical protein [Curtobacterium sp. ISL-83]MBT2503315.1 hypothetical protein [Curtobacterium sp. ISL-83]